MDAVVVGSEVAFLVPPPHTQVAKQNCITK